jgi:hypothetical protein
MRYNKKSKHAYAGQLNTFTYLRTLLVLHDRGIHTRPAYDIRPQLVLMIAGTLVLMITSVDDNEC